MAAFQFHGLDELEMSLEFLARVPEETLWGTLWAGASVLVEKWKDVLQSMKRTGQLLESIKAKRNTDSGGDGWISILVTPTGTRKREYRGLRKTETAGEYERTNAEVAYNLEYGTPRMAARHWMETANEEASHDLVAAETAFWDEFLKSLNL